MEASDESQGAREEYQRTASGSRACGLGTKWTSMVESARECGCKRVWLAIAMRPRVLQTLLRYREVIHAAPRLCFTRARIMGEPLYTHQQLAFCQALPKIELVRGRHAQDT